MNNAIRLQSIDAKCPNCGNSFKYSPNDEALKCDSCGSGKEIKFSTLNKKQSCDNVNDDNLLVWQKQNKYLKCKSCGSAIKLTNNEISIKCPYCESQNVVLKEEIEGLYPSFILRFAFDKKDASERFIAQVKKKFFVPRPFKKEIPENKIEGLYFPAFSFDADSDSRYSGRLYRRETVVSGKQQYTKTVYFNVSGSISLSHRDVLVESSAKLSQYDLEKMFPYDFTKRADFRPEYLFGYTVEQYNDQFKLVVDKGENIIKTEIKKSILNKYNYDGVSFLNIDTTLGGRSYGYFLMPLYTFEYNYNNKKYLTYMNGQTGKVGSGLPVSKIKVTFVTILGVLAVLIPIVLFLIFGDAE